MTSDYIDQSPFKIGVRRKGRSVIANHNAVSPSMKSLASVGSTGSVDRSMPKKKVRTDFHNDMLCGSKEANDRRKVVLPDIIRMSVVNLDTLAKMDTRKQKDFLDRFSKSMNVNYKQEYTYNRALANGRRPIQPYAHKVDQSKGSYIEPEHIKTLEPSNTAKGIYMKQYGSTIFNNEERMSTILHEKGKDYLRV